MNLHSRRRSTTVLALTYLVIGSFLGGALLPLAPAGATRISDTVLLNNVSTKSFEVALGPTETSHNTTVYIPLNASAVVTNASLRLRGIQVIPMLNMTGRGTAARDYESFGDGLDGGADLNNDGYQDLAVGADMVFSFNSGPGRIEVFYGSPSGIGRSANWSYDGPADAGFGAAITHGDYDNDGIDDLVVGEYDPFLSAEETIFVFFGSAAGLPSTPSLTLLLNNTSFTAWGSSISGGVDLNNDSYDDLVIGEPVYGNPSFDGRVSVLWGSPGGLNVTNITFIDGPAGIGGLYGLIVETIGDTDADGLGEFAVGSPQLSNGDGTVEVWEGMQGTTALTLLWNDTGGVGDQLGSSVAGGSDLTGDGIPDLLVGAYGHNVYVGAAYIYNGTGGAAYATSPSITLTPSTTGAEEFGWSLDVVGDYNGDGTDDVAVGAFGYGGSDGRVYLYLDRNYTTNGSLKIDVNSSDRGQYLGYRVSRAGDLNADGHGDFVATLAYGTNGTFHPGAVRTYYGTSRLFPDQIGVYIGADCVFSQPGQQAGNRTVTGFAAAIQTYLATHQGSQNATGIIQVPLSINFSGGGRLNVSNITVTYSVVLPPRNLSVSAPAVGGSLVLTWTLQPTDGTVFSVWSNKSGAWAIIANVSVPRSTYNDTNVTDGATYWYYLTEWDPSIPLQSAASAIVSGMPEDTLAPVIPINLTVSVNETAHSANISWVPNGGDTVRYEVWRKAGDAGTFEPYANVTAPAFRFTDSGLAEEVNYSYRVRAVDDAGLISAFGVTVVAYVRDLTPPTVPVNFHGATEPSGTALTLGWDLNTDDTVSYSVLRSMTNQPGSFVEIARLAGATFTDAGLGRNRTYFYQLEAIDKVALHSPPTATLAVLTVDTLPPDAPVLVTVVPVTSGNAVTLDWTATGDDLGGFKVYTDASGAWAEAAQVGGNARTAVVAGLVDGVAVNFRVAAYDLGGLLGVPSNTVSAVPRDTQRPLAPPSLTIASPPQGGSLVLTWSAPTDADVASYRVYFLDPTTSIDYVLVATVSASTMTYTHKGLSNGVTYSYQVTALDEVDNESPPSARSVGIPRDLIAPAAPRIFAPAPITNVVNYALAGTAEPNLVVEVWVNGAMRGNTTADATGNFSVTAPLRKGDNEVYVKAIDPSPLVDPAYRVSPNSASVHITLDVDKPTILTSVPAQGATDADTATVVSITFSEAVDAASVTLTVSDAQGNAVVGVLDYNNLTHVARFTPNAPLAAGARYDISVGARDPAGNGLAPASYSFTTKSSGILGGGGGFLPGFEAAMAAAALGLALLAVGVWRRR